MRSILSSSSLGYNCFGVASARPTWSLLQGKSRALDVVNHVLRVIVQLNLVPVYEDEFTALVAAQHPDGAWADQSLGARGGDPQHLL